MQLCFGALRDFATQRMEKKTMKQSVMQYAEELYLKNLRTKVLRGLRSEMAESRHQNQLSRLYTIFQAWKFFAKESALLRKYLDEADDTFQRGSDAEIQES